MFTRPSWRIAAIDLERSNMRTSQYHVTAAILARFKEGVFLDNEVKNFFDDLKTNKVIKHYSMRYTDSVREDTVIMVRIFLFDEKHLNNHWVMQNIGAPYEQKKINDSTIQDFIDYTTVVNYHDHSSFNFYKSDFFLA
jgi:hypothetical protein